MNSVVRNYGIVSNYQQPSFKGGCAKKVAQQIVPKQNIAPKKTGWLRKMMDKFLMKFSSPAKMVESNPLKEKSFERIRSIKSGLDALKFYEAIKPLNLNKKI